MSVRKVFIVVLLPVAYRNRQMKAAFVGVFFQSSER